MNKEMRYFHLFYGLAPLLVYYGISMLVVMTGDMFQWETDILNFVNGLLNLVILYVFFYRVYNKRGGDDIKSPLFLGKKGLWIVIFGMSSSIALNNWFSMFGLFETITTYEEVSESIYYGDLWMIFARTAVLAPLLEEMLARGLLYRGISILIGRVPAMVLSSCVFALMHGNLLQGIYAFLLGMMFAYIYDRFDRNLWAPILAHMSANVISVLGTSVPAVSKFFGSYYVILTGVMTILMIVSIVKISERKGGDNDR